MAMNSVTILDNSDGSGLNMKQKGTNGEGHIRIKANDVQQPSGTPLYTPLIGANGTLVALTNGAAKGPDSFIVDLSLFGASSIYLVVITATGTITHTADVQYSQDGTATYLHPTTADALWGATAGNLEAAIPKKDKFAHIILEQIGATAEDVWAYVVGREVD